MDLESKIYEFLNEGKSVVLATIYKKSGSVPRGPGAKLFVAETGEIFGTVGGGGVENKTINFAKEFFDKKEQAVFLNFNLSPGKNGENNEMICGGRVSILIEKLNPAGEITVLFNKYEEIKNKREKAIHVIDISNVKEKNYSKRYIVSQGYFPKELDDELKNKIFINGKFVNVNQLIKIKDKTYFIDPFMKEGNLILIGAGHIAAELSKLAAKVDFNVIVIDDREDFANKERFPDASEIIISDNFDNVLKIFNRYDSRYLVILTRAHLYDQTVLEQALKTDSAYIGMIGSKKKRNTIYENLLQKGVKENLLKTVYSPIGLNIGAQTPEEIAISIVAELIQVRARGVI